MSRNLHQTQSHDTLRSWQCQRNDINHHSDFVLPMFIGNDDDQVEPIDTMPEVYRYGINKAIEYLEPLVYSFGLKSVLLFPVVTKSGQKLVEAEEEEEEEQTLQPESDQEVSSSESSSRSSSASSLLSDQTFGDDNKLSTDVRPKRLLAEGGGAPPTGATTPSSQNPFLNPANEEETHLLGGDETAQVAPVGIRKSPAAAAAAHRRTSRLDIKLIKGMALKDKHNPVLRLIPKLRARFPDLLIICDVCLCAFTSTGHCCLFEDDERPLNHGQDFYSHHSLAGAAATSAQELPIKNKITCQYLAMLAAEYGLRGCNVVAPSDMMDGRISAIREKLDEKKLNRVAIMSYSAKFASAFYGPFRQATDNAPEFGDRKAYQLPPGSRTMSLKAVRRDLEEGADFIMVKPAGPYLDIVRDIKEMYPTAPIVVYQVSGEYSMLMLAAKHNIVDLKRSVNEMLTSFRRAGATIIITYFTPQLLRGEL